MKEILEALKRRYATKKFDPSKKISPEDMETLLQSLVLSPSSFGLQPWRFIHVQNAETRKLLFENSRGQPQITDAAELIVIASKTTMQESDIQEYIDSLVAQGANADTLAEYKGTMLWTIWARSEEQLKVRNQKQAYIAMWVLLTTAAILGIDTCPMEGFIPEKYNEILWLDALGLTATLVIPMGYRSAEDITASFPKFRYSKDKLIINR